MSYLAEITNACQEFGYSAKFSEGAIFIRSATGDSWMINKAGNKYILKHQSNRDKRGRWHLHPCAKQFVERPEDTLTAIERILRTIKDHDNWVFYGRGSFFGKVLNQ